MAMHGLLSNANRPRPKLTVAVVFLGAILSTLQGRMFSVALPDLRGQFGLDLIEAAWLSTVLNGAQIVSMTLVPWLASVVGSMRLLVFPSLVLASSALVLPLFVHNYPTLHFLHGMMGLCLGVYPSLTISLALGHTHPRLTMLVLAAYSLRVSAGLDGGVGASGILLEDLNWHSIYWASVAIAPLIAAIAWKAIPLSQIDWQKLRQADTGGMAIFCGGLVLFYTGIESGERLGWADSGLVMAALAGGTLLLTATILRALRWPQAFGSPAGFHNRNMVVALMISSLFGMLASPNLVLIPSFLAQMGDLKPLQTGTANMVSLLAYVGFTPLAMYVARRIEPRLLVMLGASIIGVAALLGTHISNDWRLDQFLSLLITQAAGECFFLLGSLVTFLTNGKPQLGLQFAAYLGIVRVITPAIAATFMSHWLRVTGDNSYASLSAFVPSGEPNVLLRAETGLNGIAGVLSRESHVIAQISGYNLVFWCSVLAVSLAMLLRPSPPNGIAPPLLPAVHG
ncbi:MFS transporter [Comamonas sp. MYb21]|uniref:MFS transporter n=1 Tax=Comamonas sp. MYb21 TaxID=1848648 RepID=UPI00309E1B6B